MLAKAQNRRFKRWLVGLLFLGVIAFSGTGGTFASFNAQTTNPNSGIASGTLTLSDTASGTTCLSSGGSNASGNANNNCASVLNLAGVEPGSWPVSGSSPYTPTQTAQVAVENAGSLAASKFELEAPSLNDCYDTKTAAGTSISGTAVNFNSTADVATNVSLVVGSATATIATGSYPTAINGMTILGSGITAGTTVSSVSGTTLTMSAVATSTEASETLDFQLTLSGVLTLGSATVTPATGTFPSSITGMTIVGGTTGYVQVGTVVTSVASGGLSLTMSAIATASGTIAMTFGENAFCSSVLMFVQEQAGSNYYCWYGAGSSGSTTGASEAATEGLCEEPVEVTTSGTILAGTVTSVPVSALSGPVFVGDTLTATNSAGTSQTFQVALPTGSSSLSVTTTTSSATVTSAAAFGPITPGMAITGTGIPAGATVSSVTSPSSLTMSVAATTGGSITAGFGKSAYLPGAPISVNVVSTTSIALNSGSAVVDTTVNGALNGDVTDTVANFDTKYAVGTSVLTLAPINGAGTVNTAVPYVALASTATRTFTIGLYMPNPNSIDDNYLQGLQSTFGLTWYLQQ